jgi:hypothetical protein
MLKELVEREIHVLIIAVFCYLQCRHLLQHTCVLLALAAHEHPESTERTGGCRFFSRSDAMLHIPSASLATGWQ